MPASIGRGIVIRAPMPPNLANGRMHWATKHKKRAAFMKALDDRQGAGLIPRPPETRWRHVELSSVMTLHQAMDPDNAVARHKWAIDWLVTRGYLADDAALNVRWNGFPTQIISRSKPAEIELTITQELSNVP
jgi:hypothetical protein